MNRNKFKRQLPLYFMLIPGVLVVLVYNYLPMIGLIIAFQDFVPGEGFFRSEWVGLDNFKYLFGMNNFPRVIWNTIYIAAAKILLMIVVPVVFALLLNEIRNKHFKRGVQTAIYLPHFLSWIILAGILIDILSPSTGMINQVIKFFGGKPIFFLGDNKWFPTVVIASDVWKEFGYGTIIYLAALTGIDPGLYEAAYVDGAGRWRQLLHVTLPGITPMVVLMTTLSIGGILGANFDQIFNLYSPAVYESGDVLDTLIYRIGLVDAQFSLSTAASLFRSLVGLVLTVVSYKTAHKLTGYRPF